MAEEGEDFLRQSLLKRLAGPSVQKSGQEGVDQDKVNEIIYKASVGSKFFLNEQKKHAELTKKIDDVLQKVKLVSKQERANEERRADEMIRKMEMTRHLSQFIVHVDCDYFYGQVEELDNPKLKTIPFGVGGGVLTTCNYLARKFGIRSAMPGHIAQKICPELVIVPLNFDKYIDKAREVRAVISKYDPNYLSASLDEAYLNITSYVNEHECDPEEAVASMRAEILQQTKLTVSAGIGANSLLAKIGSNRNKPNGQFRIASRREDILSFMHVMPVRKVNGIGKVFERELEALGVVACGDIYKERGVLAKLFGEKSFDFLLGVYLGLGNTNIRPAEDHERKSIGTESTFRDIHTAEDLLEKLRWTAEELEKDLTRTKLSGRTLHLKLKKDTYDVITRQRSLPKLIHTKEDLFKYARPLLEKEMPTKLRLMGLRLTHLANQIDKSTVCENFFGGIDTSEYGRVKRGLECETFSPRKKYNKMGESAERIESGIDVMHEFEMDGEEVDRNQKEQFAKEEVQNFCSCPICGRKVEADDAILNLHIDLCLNANLVKEAVKGTFAAASKANTGFMIG